MEDPKPAKEMTGPDNYRRRVNLTSSDVEQMRKLEAEGKSRKQISIILNCTPGSVTRKLGAVRAYRGIRATLEKSKETS